MIVIMSTIDEFLKFFIFRMSSTVRVLSPALSPWEREIHALQLRCPREKEPSPERIPQFVRSFRALSPQPLSTSLSLYRVRSPMATGETTVDGSGYVPEYTIPPSPSSADAGVSASGAEEGIETPSREFELASSPVEVNAASASAAGVGSNSADKKWPGWPGDCVFRLIVPVLKVGSIIGRKGELIKKMCEETRARIRILDAPVGTPDRIVSEDASFATYGYC